MLRIIVRIQFQSHNNFSFHTLETYSLSSPQLLFTYFQSTSTSNSKSSLKNYRWLYYISSPMSITIHPGGHGEQILPLTIPIASFNLTVFLLFSKHSLILKTYSGVGKSGVHNVRANQVSAPSLIICFIAYGKILYTSS